MVSSQSLTYVIIFEQQKLGRFSCGHARSVHLGHSQRVNGLQGLRIVEPCLIPSGEESDVLDIVDMSPIHAYQSHPVAVAVSAFLAASLLASGVSSAVRCCFLVSRPTSVQQRGAAFIHHGAHQVLQRHSAAVVYCRAV